MKRLLPFVFFFLIGVVWGHPTGAPYVATEPEDLFVCQIDMISRVKVILEGEHLADKRNNLEQLIRLRLRNDLSMFSHEETFSWDIENKYVGDGSEKDLDKMRYEMERRGQVECLVMTVGDDYPIAALFECKLWGWGDWRDNIWVRLKSRSLGFTSKEKLYDFADTAIRDHIADISAQLLELRDSECN